MAICERCGCKYRMNWVRMQPCPVCRGGKGRVNHPATPVSGGTVKGSHVTVTFELTPEIDPQRFVEWLQVECGVAEDGEGPIKGGVKLCDPVQITLHSWDGK